MDEWINALKAIHSQMKVQSAMRGRGGSNSLGKGEGTGRTLVLNVNGWGGGLQGEWESLGGHLPIQGLPWGLRW